MKKILIFIILSNFSFICLSSFAVEPKCAHTSAKDIEFKKKKALKWHEDQVTNKKSYFVNADKEVAFKKKKALKWHEDQVANKKSYFVNADKEIAFKKKKALHWHDRNSQ